MLELYLFQDYCDVLGDIPLCSDCANKFATSPALLHARIYSLADRYLAPGLKSKAYSKFEDAVARVSGAALAEVVNEVYSNTLESDRGLRDIVVKHAETTVAELICQKAFVEGVRNTDCFGMDLTESIVNKVLKQEVHSYSTRDCSHCPVQPTSTPSLCCPHQYPARCRPVQIL